MVGAFAEGGRSQAVPDPATVWLADGAVGARRVVVGEVDVPPVSPVCRNSGLAESVTYALPACSVSWLQPWLPADGGRLPDQLILSPLTWLASWLR